MSLDEKINFVFNCYDFDESGELTMDEMCLSFKSTLTGLCKLSGQPCPTELELEELAGAAFAAADSNSDNKISRQEFEHFCLRQPETKTWLEFFDDLSDTTSGLSVLGGPVAPSAAADDAAALHEALAEECVWSERTALQRRLLNVDVRGVAGCDDVCTAARAWPWSDPVRLAKLTPSALEGAPPAGHTPPRSNLELEWVHGYSGRTQRGNVRYTDAGEIVYPAARMGVVLNRTGRQQRFHMGHTDDVTCLAVTTIVKMPTSATETQTERTIVATGSIGERASIIVWDADTCETLATLRGVHRGAITHLDFSPDGSMLLSIGMDEDHTVCVHELPPLTFDGGAENAPALSAIPIFADQGGKETVFDARWVTPTRFAVCGVNHVRFWTKSPATRSYRMRAGVFGRIAKEETLTCLSSHPGRLVDGVVTGTMSGAMLVWYGRNCVRSVPAHSDGPVLCLHAVSRLGLVSGGQDGTVVLWNTRMEKGSRFSLHRLGTSHDPSVRSVCWAPQAHRILVGTMACEIYEISDSDGSDIHRHPLLQSHITGDLRGLAWHPERLEYATAGDDGTVRVWDVATRAQLRVTEFKSTLRAIAYSADGAQLAVGCGPNLGTFGDAPDKSGVVYILDATELTKVRTIRDARGPITQLRFNPLGDTLAVASSDGVVYFYDTTGGEYVMRAPFTSHGGAAITHLDFDAEGLMCRSLDEQGTLLYSFAETGEEVTDTVSLRDTVLSTWTTPAGWAVRGVWDGARDDGGTVVALDRSHSGKIIASVDSMGRTRLLRYPCTAANGVISAEFGGHSFGVRSVGFAVDDSYLCTLGGEDRCIMQWRVILPSNVVASDNREPLLGGASVDACAEGIDAVDVAADAAIERNPPLEAMNSRDVVALDKIAHDLLADVARTDKPWRAAVIAPSSAETEPPVSVAPPSDELQLDWIHGCTIGSTRSALQYVGTSGRNDLVVYPAGKVLVFLNTAQHTQRFIHEHTDAISCVAVSPNGRWVASGQYGLTPKIVVTDATTLKVVRVIDGFHRRSIDALAFSSDSTFLATAGGDDEHCVAVYNWRDASIAALTPTGQGKVLDIAFAPSSSPFFFLSCGTAASGPPTFWVRQGRNLLGHRAQLNKQAKAGTCLCAAFVGNCAVVGRADGHMLVFEENSNVLNNAVKAHRKPVTSVHVSTEGAGCVSCSIDGHVKMWDADMEIVEDFSIHSLGSSIDPAVKSVCWAPGVHRILVGTRGCEVFEISDEDGKDVNQGAHVQGHCSNETWAVAWHPSKNEFVTVGDDCTVRVWDADRKKLARATKLEGALRAVTYHPDGASIIVGYGASPDSGVPKSDKDGKFAVLDAVRLGIQYDAHDARGFITDAKFSRDGRTLFLSSADNNVYVYDAEKQYALRCTFSKHTAPVLSLDVSVDGETVRSNCANSELLFSNADDGAHIFSAAAVRDTEWATVNCALTYETSGSIPPYMDEADVHTVDRSPDGALLVMGDALGELKLYRNPCTAEANSWRRYSGHTSRVSCARFSASGKCLVSMGSEDRCVFQWKVVSATDDWAANAAAAAATATDDDAVTVGPPLKPAHTLLEDTVGGETTQHPWLSSTVEPSTHADRLAATAAAASKAGEEEEDDEEASSAAPSAAPSAESASLALEHVYGLSDPRSGGLRFNASGEMVYYAANAGVIYNKRNHRQRFYIGHDGDIACMAVDGPARCIATGELARWPRLHIWDSQSAAPLGISPEFHHDGICSVAFSPSGREVLSVGNDARHTVAIWISDTGMWHDIRLSCSGECGPSASNGIKCAVALRPPTSSLRSASGAKQAMWFTGGTKHAMFWNSEAGKLSSWRGTYGDFADDDGSISISAVVLLEDGTLATGTAKGDLLLWDAETAAVVKSVSCHNGPLYALWSPPPLSIRIKGVPHEDHGLLCVTGGADGIVKSWGEGWRIKTMHTYELNTVPVLVAMGSAAGTAALAMGSEAGGSNSAAVGALSGSGAGASASELAIRSICMDTLNGSLLVGTLGCDVVELYSAKAALISSAHCRGELWGISVHPKDRTRFVTTGDDATMRIWDSDARQMVNMQQLDSGARALAFSPDGKTMAVGLGIGRPQPHLNNEGAFNIFTFERRGAKITLTNEARPAKSWIREMRFSADGEMCGCASEDSNVYILGGTDFELRETLRGLTGPATHLDFSTDGNVVQVTSAQSAGEAEGTVAGHELAFHNPRDGAAIDEPSKTRVRPRVLCHTLSLPHPPPPPSL